MIAIQQRTLRTFSAILLALSLVATLATPAARGQDNLPQTGVQLPGTTPDQSQSRWPMSFSTDQGQITIYQPQLTSFDGNKVTGRAAVSVIKPGATDPIFGAVWMESRVSVDRSTRIVQIIDVNVTKAVFPDQNGVDPQTLTGVLQSTLPGQNMHLTLDQLLAEVQVIQQEHQAVKEINNDPPHIIIQDHPAVLVQYDGQPKFTPAPNSNLLRADNTPFFVALDPVSRTYFLKGGGRWFATQDPLGSFQYVPTVPPAIAQLADDSGYKDPQTALSEPQAQSIQIITATEPTELIWTDGPEQLTPIDNTNLLYLANTDSDVFLAIDTQKIFVLLSGRWFTSASRNGPWAFVPPDQLPPDFKNIPPSSPKGNVLAHVAGTQQAQDAVANAYIPQTASIDRANFDQPTVQYDGDPNFQPIDNTPMSYAVNTPNSVLQVNGQYYCCSNAAWYASASPAGPWALCTSVPDVIYTIPSSCPIYPCRYVYVYGYTPDVVYCGYLPGYAGCYPCNGVVVYGTGYRYHPWDGHDYYPRACTYGFGAHYDAYSGHWGFQIGFFSGDSTGWFGDRTGPIARRGGWFGHGGFRPAYQSRYDENRPAVDVRHDELNLYQRRKDIRPDYRPENNGHPADFHADQPRGDEPRNDVLTDPDGHIYRKTDNGWEQRSGNNWVHSDEPTGQQGHDDRRPDQTPHDATPHHDEPAPSDQHHDDHADQHHDQPAPDQPHEDHHNPAPSGNNDHADKGSLDKDYNARVQGDQRGQSNPRNGAQQQHGDQQQHGSQTQHGSQQGQGGSGNAGGNTGKNH